MLASLMERNTATPGLAIRAMTAEDIPAGLRLCRASNWNQLEDDWRVFLNSTGGGGFLAGKEGRVVGTVAFLRYDSFAWIAMMLVDPHERGAGIGAHLMEEALSALQDVDCIGLDATPMGEPLYRRFGFVNDYALVRMKATIEAARLHAPSPGVRRMRREDLSDVLRRDREVFGAGRGELLTSLFERAPKCAWIVKDGAALRGYTFGRPGWLYHQLGPVVAEDCGTARALVARGLSELDGKRVAIDAPRPSTVTLDGEWPAWLGSIGFVEERPFVRMFRHSHAHHSHARPGMPARQYAIAGPEFG
jgi:predicted N-acetyltransferase YhbS